jgi:hypothetical protein
VPVRWSIELDIDDGQRDNLQAERTPDPCAQAQNLPKERLTPTFTTKPGEVQAFEAPYGLWAEATATAYDDRRVHVRVKLHERDINGDLHWIGTLIASAPFESYLEGYRGHYRGVLAGAKGYEARLVVAGSPL